MVEEEAATVAASRVAAPGPPIAVMVVSSFAALPHFFGAREGATLFLAASNARFVVREDALRLHVHAGSEAKTGSKVATLAGKLKKLNYSCPPAVPTARDAERPRIAAHAARPRIIAAHGPVFSLSRCGTAP